ncbi:SOS response-associated peptidase family protein [Falsiroseomonas sp. HW251]|uniref:SOS response-associated peptidase family protein n=1 Tax=Falsiroseomonas sp. HW251 TaxID=3390998 RepID=UPI003D313CDE
MLDGALPGDVTTLGAPPYHRAPGEDCFVVARDPDSGDPVATAMRWGLRVEGRRCRLVRADEYAARGAARMFPCIVPVSGFVQQGRRRTRVAVTLAASTTLAMAALWQQQAGGAAFAIVTTDAGGDIATMLPRMPVLLPPAAWPQWLAGLPPTAVELNRLARPAPAAWFRLALQSELPRRDAALSVARQIEAWAPGSMTAPRRERRPLRHGTWEPGHALG